MRCCRLLRWHHFYYEPDANEEKLLKGEHRGKVSISFNIVIKLWETGHCKSCNVTRKVRCVFCLKPLAKYTPDNCSCFSLFCNVCKCGFCNVRVCVCVGFVMCECALCGFCNVWVCVCVGFVMCGFVYVWVL